MTIPNDDIPAQIVPMILYRLKDTLETVMVHEVPSENPTRALLVKVGRFQENPARINVSLSISGGDFENPKYLDGRVDHEDLNAISIRNLPVGEIGGGLYWWRRGTINFQCFFVRQGYDEDRALQYAYDFHGRLIAAVEETLLNDLVDDYGEGAYDRPLVEGTSFFEGGGAKKYIWRGKLYFRVLTWRKPR